MIHQLLAITQEAPIENTIFTVMITDSMDAVQTPSKMFSH